jgi:hypothetical protein
MHLEHLKEALGHLYQPPAMLTNSHEFPFPPVRLLQLRTEALPVLSAYMCGRLFQGKTTQVKSSIETEVLLLAFTERDI